MIEQKKFLPLNEAFDAASNLLLQSITSEQGGLTSEQREFYRLHPIEFSRDILGNDPYDRQEEILFSLASNPRTTVRSAHGVGKTWSAAGGILWFISSFVPSTVVTTAPTARQVRDILWKEINVQYYKAKTPLGGRILTQQLIMSDREKWFATGFTTEEHDLDRFQGFHNINILVVIDEACGVSKTIYDAVEGLLSAGLMVRLLLIGNPTNENTEFGKSFKSQLYDKFHLSAFDSPNFTTFGITIEDMRNNTWEKKIVGDLPRPYLTTPKWVYERYQEWGEDSPLYQVRVMGNFPEEAEDTLIPLFWIERAQLLNLEPSGVKSLGVDIARSGGDESVIIMRHGGVASAPKVWTHKDTMQSTGIIKNYIDEHKPDIVNIDVIGMGAGVVDRLNEQEYGVNGVNVGERATEPDKYFNLRSELYWKIRQKLERSELELPDDSILTNELTGFRYEFTSKGQLKLEPKEKTKDRVGKSPDRADSLALTLYEKRQGMVVINEDLSGLYNEQERMQEERDSSLGMEKLSNVAELMYNRFEVQQSIFVCPNCSHSEGLIYLNEQGTTNKESATHFKCIICNIKQEIETLEIGGK